MEDTDTQAMTSDKSVEEALLSAKRKMAVIEEKAGLCRALLNLTGVESSLAGQKRHEFTELSSQRIEVDNLFEPTDLNTSDRRSIELDYKNLAYN